MEARLKDLEFKVKEHDRQLERLFKKADSMDDHLGRIQKTLDQIKYMAWGALAYLAVSELGILGSFKAVI